jgi:hypothetical protein
MAPPRGPRNIYNKGKARWIEGESLIRNNPDNPFDVSSEILSDVYYFFSKRMEFMHSNDYRNKTRIIGLIHLCRAAYKVLPEIRRDFEDQGIVVRRENNEL